PTYRSIYAKDAYADLGPGQLIRLSCPLFPASLPFVCNTYSQVHDKPGPFVWDTYSQVHDKVLHLGSAYRAAGLEAVSRGRKEGSGRRESGGREREVGSLRVGHVLPAGISLSCCWVGSSELGEGKVGEGEGRDGKRGGRRGRGRGSAYRAAGLEAVSRGREWGAGKGKEGNGRWGSGGWEGKGRGRGSAYRAAGLEAVRGGTSKGREAGGEGRGAGGRKGGKKGGRRSGGRNARWKSTPYAHLFDAASNKPLFTSSNSFLPVSLHHLSLPPSERQGGHLRQQLAASQVVHFSLNPFLPRPTPSSLVQPLPPSSNPFLPRPTPFYLVQPLSTSSNPFLPRPTPFYLVQPLSTSSNPFLPRSTPLTTTTPPHQNAKNAKVGIYGINSPEWFMAMEACNCQSMQCVPLYDTLGAEAVSFILNHAEVALVVVQAALLLLPPPPLLCITQLSVSALPLSSPLSSLHAGAEAVSFILNHAEVALVVVQAAKIPAVVQAAKIPACCESLTFWISQAAVVSMGALDADSAKALTDMGIRGVTWDDFLKEGEEKPVEPCPSKPEDICTIMYTSGGFRWFVMYTSGGFRCFLRWVQIRLVVALVSPSCFDVAHYSHHLSPTVPTAPPCCPSTPQSIGTTGEPKGVLITNHALATAVAGTKRPSRTAVAGTKRSCEVNTCVVRGGEAGGWGKKGMHRPGCCASGGTLATAVAGTQLTEADIYISYLPLAHIFDRLTEADIYISYLPLAHIFDRVAEELMTSPFDVPLYPPHPSHPHSSPKRISTFPTCPWHTSFDRLTEADIYISYLPLAHIFDRVAEELMTHVGGSIGFWQGGLWHNIFVAEELMALKPAPPHTLALFLFASLLSSPPLHLYARHSPLSHQDDVRNLTNDLDGPQATFFCGVPRIFDRIHSAVISKIESTGGLTKMLFDYAYSSKQARLTHLPPLFPLPTLFPLTIPAVISKIESTGGLTKIAVRLCLQQQASAAGSRDQGAAGRQRADYLLRCRPLAPHVEEFLKIAMCCPRGAGYGEFESGYSAIEGYGESATCAGLWPHGDQHERLHLVRGSHRAGHHCWAAHAQPSHSYAPHNPFLCRRFSLTPPGLTETNTSGFISYADRIEQAGTVGPPMPTLETRLESIPEMNYDAIGSTKQEGESGEAQVHPPRGEVCIRGPILFSGYYKREDLTKEAVDAEGWFHTGDIGEWQADGSMKIIDRKKNIFKLAQGEYVAVENLENVFGNCTALDMYLDPCEYQGGEWQADGSMKIIDQKKNIFKLAQGEYVAVENLENVFGNCTALDMVRRCFYLGCVAVVPSVPVWQMEWRVADGSMKIIDRKKNIFKLAQGEYVAVENLENVFGWFLTCLATARLLTW
ncbi:unnamed protein product, partial [Closterium sp. Naga37s-1]